MSDVLQCWRKHILSRLMIDQSGREDFSARGQVRHTLYSASATCCIYLTIRRMIHTCLAKVTRSSHWGQKVCSPPSHVYGNLSHLHRFPITPVFPPPPAFRNDFPIFANLMCALPSIRLQLPQYQTSISTANRRTSSGGKEPCSDVKFLMRLRMRDSECPVHQVEVTHHTQTQGVIISRPSMQRSRSKWICL